MQPIILSGEQIDEAAALLKRGEVIAIPTETVYGLAAPIFNAPAIEKIFFLKNRPLDNPLIAHVATFSMAESIIKDRGALFYRLVHAFWPGPLTLILPKQDTVPLIATARLNTIALRMPSHPIALRLIEAVGEPLVAPSANLSGRPSPTSAAHVLEDFPDRLAAILEGGPCSIGIESTVLSLAGEIPTLLRPGAISRQQIEEVLKMNLAAGSAVDKMLSPGMKYRHYAPKAPIFLVSNLPPSCGTDSFVLSREPTGICVYRPLNAKNLYAFFREADRIHADQIWVLLDSASCADEALMNRLRKAAGEI